MVNANVVSQYRTAIQQLLAALDSCRNIELQMNAEGGASSLFVSGDFTGSNADLSTTIMSNGVTSRGAIETLLSANGNAHYTNLMKFRP